MSIEVISRAAAGYAGAVWRLLFIEDEMDEPDMDEYLDVVREVPALEVAVAPTLVAARRDLSNRESVLVVLDRRMPENEGDKPVLQGGASLIIDLDEGRLGELNRGTPFIVLTSTELETSFDEARLGEHERCVGEFVKGDDVEEFEQAVRERLRSLGVFLDAGADPWVETVVCVVREKRGKRERWGVVVPAWGGERLAWVPADHIPADVVEAAPRGDSWWKGYVNLGAEKPSELGFHDAERLPDLGLDEP